MKQYRYLNYYEYIADRGHVAVAMYYTTELIEKILKSPKAREIIGWLPPVYGEAYVFLWLLEAIGRELDDMAEWSEGLKDQALPQTATWSLPYWEERYGIPSNPELPVERRRASILFKMNSRAPVNPHKLEEIVSKVTGVPTGVEENTGKNRFAVRCLGYIDSLAVERAKEQINLIKPSHLVYDINVAIRHKTGHVSYMPVVLQVRKTYEVEVV